MRFLAALTGAVICLMQVANAALQRTLDPVTSLLVVHATGLALVLPLALLGRAKAPRPTPVRWPLFLAGFVGIALLLINNRTIPVLGAALTVSLGVLGQLAASALVDHFGLFGLVRRPFRAVQVLGLAAVVAGVLLMNRGGI